MRATTTLWQDFKRQSIQEAVIQLMCREGLGAVTMERLDQLFASDLDPLRTLEGYSLRYLGYFDERRDLFRILLYEREVTRASGQRFRGDRYRHLLERCTRVVRDGIDAGVFRDVDPGKAAAMFVEANFAIMNQRLRGGSPTPVEDDARLISDIFLRGLIKRRSK